MKRKNKRTMKRKKQLMTLVLSLSMIFTFSFPTAVFALETNTGNEIAVYNENNIDAIEGENDSTDNAGSQENRQKSEEEVLNKKALDNGKEALDGQAEPNASDANTVYVSNVGKEDAAGTEEDPYDSLANAVDAINKKTDKDYTIVILSNLTATRCARINSKNITIKGNGHTISRGDDFSQIQDNARSTYNPAMIEVCDSSHNNHASLRLENITLTDAGKTAGTKYSQASTDGKGGNGDTVQDGIIATYDGVGTITLGNGTVLDGYGGMSAVRISGGTLIMEDGSKITGGKNFTTKGGGNGAAGAVWSQGGKLTIDQGAEISGIMGRAIYLDGRGSEAFVNGTISDVTYNVNMWNGSGSAVHARNYSKFVLGPNGKIKDISANCVTLYVTQSDFETQKGSEISNIQINTRIMEVWSAKNIDKNPGCTLLNGTIKDCKYGDVGLFAFMGLYIIGEDAVIEKVSKTKSGIGLFYLQNGGEMNVHGKIQNNDNNMVYMGNQGGADTYVRVYDKAYIHGNDGYGIYANNSGKVEISGGEISGNSNYGVYVRSKKDWKNPALNMTGGKIINNKSTGIQYVTIANSKYSKINISGGEISGNGSSFSPNQISISGENAEDTLSRVYIKPGVVKAANDRLDSINTSFATITDINLGDGNEDFYVGNAKSTASEEIEKQIKTYKETEDDIYDYESKGSALWFKTPGDELNFDATRYSSANKALPLYVAYIPVKEDGTPEDGAKATFKKVENVDIVDIELEGLEKDQSYAMMWMQPTEKFGFIELEGTPEIQEELNVTDYIVDYTVKYTLLKDIASLAKPGDEFKIQVKLDKRLTYDETIEGATATLDKINEKDSEAFEFVGTEYNNDKKTLTFTLKIKEGFKPKYSFSRYPANISFKVKAKVDDFGADDLSTDASISGSVVLSGDTDATDFKLDLLNPAKTDLVPLPSYTVTYRFESRTLNREIPASVYALLPRAATVKEGAEFTPEAPPRTSVSVPGGTWNFIGYSDLGEITDDVTIVGRWTYTAAPPVTPVTPVTPGTPPTAGGAGLAVITGGAVPVANIDANEDLVEVEDEDTPLAKAPTGSWALLNLILAIFTALVSILSFVFYFKDKSDEEERMGMFRILSIVPALAAVALFILTEDMSLPMAITDKWTLLMAVFAVMNVVFAFLAKKQSEDDEETV